MVTKRLKWKWDDGKFHNTPPPAGREPKDEIPLTKRGEKEEAAPVPHGSSEAVTGQDALVLPTWTHSHVVDTKAKPEARPPVPVEFIYTDRRKLRALAMEYALRAGSLMRGVVTGEELIKAAEEIEKWIAQA